jgi:hypothetical protein
MEGFNLPAAQSVISGLRRLAAQFISCPDNRRDPRSSRAVDSSILTYGAELLPGASAAYRLSSAAGNGGTPLPVGWREGLGGIRQPRTFIRDGDAEGTITSP